MVQVSVCVQPCTVSDEQPTGAIQEALVGGERCPQVSKAVWWHHKHRIPCEGAVFYALLW